MSTKFLNTIADYLDWNQAMNLVRKLYDDKNYLMSLLISFGAFWRLRISDKLSLKWNCTAIAIKQTHSLIEFPEPYPAVPPAQFSTLLSLSISGFA
jgi:integrase